MMVLRSRVQPRSPFKHHRFPRDTILCAERGISEPDKATLGDDISIVPAGHPFQEADYGLEKVLQNHGLLPSISAVAKLYRHSHLDLVIIYTPHPSYQPFEYMACGCATVTNYNEGTSWLLKNEVNAFLCDSTVSAVTERIVTAAQDDVLRQRVIEGALQTVAGLDWDRELERLVNYMCNPSPTTDRKRTVA